jgi:hypothetical protein
MDYLLPYTSGGPITILAGAGVFQAEQNLNNMFRKVKKLDKPVRVAEAEVGYESTFRLEVTQGLSAYMPLSSIMDNAIQALARACGFATP